MSFELETHPNGLILLPCLAFVDAECEDCGDRHFTISFGLFIWSVYVHFGPHQDDEFPIE